MALISLDHPQKLWTMKMNTMKLKLSFNPNYHQTVGEYNTSFNVRDTLTLKIPGYHTPK